ncbi:hypothetical protein GQ457_18G013120 [Hibiscus cannabinus]
MADQEIEFADKNLEIINRNEDEDNDNSDSDNDDLIGDDKTINNFISEEVWDIIGKELKDFDESGMDMLKWASIEECIEFYYTYAKVKGFGVRKEHNHEMLNPTHVPYIRSFRKISDADQVKISNMHNSGIAPNRMMQSFVNEAGSLENVGFIQKDLYNFVDKIKREEEKDSDAEMMMAYLYGKQEIDPFFFVRYTRDEKENLEKIFWCDGISRIDYKEFGQVLVFDTTYKCNEYNKPFVVLVGVNHHRNTVPFGCALIVNEKEDTYVWVLEQLIAAGDGYKPLTVITDRDKAMTNSISKVLPEAKHRLCLWHLLRNVKLYGNRKFHEGFMKCVDKCRTQTDFEKAWKGLVCKHDCQDKKWAKDLYEDKEKWAEAYMQGDFYAAMRSTQHCESMHRTLKSLLDRKILYGGRKVVKTTRQLMNNQFVTLESVGFPCRHMFAVLKYEKAKEIPQGCILKRWTINAKNIVELKKNNMDIKGDNPAAIQARYAHLASFCMNICHRASQSYETFNEFKDQIAKMSMKLQKVKGRGQKITSESRVLGIGDPKILETGKGLHKKAKGKASSANMNMKHIDTPQLSNIAMYMPNTYKEGDIYEASRRHELDDMDEDPTIFDWQPNKDW